MSEIVHHVFTASSGTISMLTGITEYSRLDEFLNWAAVEYVEKKREIKSSDFFSAVKEMHSEYLKGAKHV